MQRSNQSATGGPQTTRLIIAIALAGLVGANVLWLVPSARDARDNAALLRLEIAGRAGDAVHSFLETKKSALADAADELRFAPEAAEYTLGRLLKRHPEFNSVIFLDGESGKERMISRFEVDKEEIIRFRPELVGLVPGRVYAGEVERSENLDPVVTLAIAIASRGAAPPRDFRRSALLAELNLKFLSEVVTRFRFGESGKIYIVDEKGFLIIDPDISLVLKRPDLRDRPIVREILEKKSDARVARHTNDRGVSVEASGIFVPGLEWGIVSEQDLAEVNALRNRILLLAAISLSIGVSLIAALAANSRVIARANRRLQELLRENYESAKMLIRRDRELVATDTRLRELITELESVGKMLVRRDLELTLANARLEELDIVKSEFVSIAAHQLRTPLTGIRWSYQSLLGPGGGAEKLRPEERHLLESGLGATLRMIELVNDLLNVARIEEGKFGIRLRKQQLLAVIEAFSGRYAELAKDKGLVFSLEIQEDRPLPEIAFDEERIGLVLDNMLDNALKYTPAGGKIAVRVSQEKNFVRVEVADTGIGIPQDQLHRVFSKFFRAENAVRLHTSGTGLGLYLGRNIIEKHGGSLEVKSTEGKGSVFSFTLPVAPS